MADNIVIDAGADKTVATDDVGDVHFQKVKLDVGGDGVSVPFTNTIGTIQNLNAGTITSIGVLPDLPGGTLDVGTMVGGAASGVAASGNPNQIAGTDGGGTIYSMLVDTAGNPQVDIVNSPTVNLNDLPGGTVDLVTTVSNLTNGSVRMTVGTVTVLPDLPGGTLDVGTMVGGAASGAAASGNPNQIAGTDGGGTIYSMLVNTAGNPQVDIVNSPTVSLNDLPGGTVDLVTTVSNLTSGSVRMTVGTVSVLPDLPGGTIDLITTTTNLTSGSVRMTVGTMTTGSLANVAQVHNAGTIQAGTIQIDTFPPRRVLRYGTLGTTAVAVRGTLVAAAGAGDNYYILGYEIVQHTGTTDAAIELGTKAVVGGTDTFGRGFYVPGGGVSRNLTSAIESGANGTITFFMGGAGTTWFAVDYYEIG